MTTHQVLTKISLCMVLSSLTGSLVLMADHHETEEKKIVLGYTDTPILPGTDWHVHDPDRPRPHAVTPGTTFSHSAPPPGDATILFDGRDLSQWKSEKGGPAGWKIKDGFMEVIPETGDIVTKESFGSFQLHVEFATPHEVTEHSQDRGNSGIFLHGEYEVQVLDSFQSPTYPDGQAGALYGQTPPLVNASKPPGAWQSYDIIFEAPMWDGGELVRKACLTLIHNGVVLHHKKAYIGSTSHKQVGKYKKHPYRGPIKLQDHDNPMRFRNIWIRELGEYDKP